MESYLRVAEICHRTGLSRWTIWRMAKAGQFPQPVKLATRAVGWLASEVETWMQQRQEERQ